MSSRRLNINMYAHFSSVLAEVVGRKAIQRRKAVGTRKAIQSAVVLAVQS